MNHHGQGRRKRRRKRRQSGRHYLTMSTFPIMFLFSESASFLPLCLLGMFWRLHPYSTLRMHFACAFIAALGSLCQCCWKFGYWNVCTVCTVWQKNTVEFWLWVKACATEGWWHCSMRVSIQSWWPWECLWWAVFEFIDQHWMHTLPLSFCWVLQKPGNDLLSRDRSDSHQKFKPT